MMSFRLGEPGFNPNSVDTVDRPFYVVKPDAPLSLSWRAFHVCVCMLGAIAFFLGSTQYSPARDHHTRGSLLFTMGSAGYFASDFADFWLHHRFEFFQPTAESCEDGSGWSIALPLTYHQWFRHHERSLNALLTASGSLCYLVGCVLFIPAFGHEILGDILFIPGSFIIMVSEMWAIYRAGCTVQTHDGFSFVDNQFQFSNIANGSIVSFYGDVATWIGAALFLAGSVMFLPAYDVDDFDTYASAFVFVAGSIMFILAACCLCVKYFYPSATSRKAADLDLYAQLDTVSTGSGSGSSGMLSSMLDHAAPLPV